METQLLISLLFVSLASYLFINNNISSALGAAAGGIIGAQFGSGTGKLFMTAISAGALVGGEISDELSGDKVRKKFEELGLRKTLLSYKTVSINL